MSRIPFFPNSFSDELFVNRLHDGDNDIFTVFYNKNRDKFYKHFSIRCTIDDKGKYKFMNDDCYLDDLYHDSCLKLFEKIMLGKIYVHEGKIHVINRYNEPGVMKGTLYNYLESIGDYTLKEAERTEGQYTPLTTDRPPSTSEQDDDSEVERDFEPLSDLSMDPELFEEDDKVAIVRRIVKFMSDPCKKIFTLRYWEDGDGKLKMSDIAKEMGYASADVAKNQHSRCVKQFKDVFAKACAKLKI